MGDGELLDRHIVARAARGDRAAMEDVLRTIRPHVVRYCRARLGPVGSGYVEADDVAQVVLTAVYKALPRYKDQGVPFTAWWVRIAARKVVDAQRDAARNARAEPTDLSLIHAGDVAAGPEQWVETLDLARRMARLLDTLTELQREIIVLRVAVGMPADEVGAVLGMTAVAVRVAQSRALAALRKAAPAFLEVPK